MSLVEKGQKKMNKEKFQGHWHTIRGTKIWHALSRVPLVIGLTALCALAGPYILWFGGMSADLAFDEWDAIWPTEQEMVDELNMFKLCQKDPTCELDKADYKHLIEIMGDLKEMQTVNGEREDFYGCHP